MQRIFPFGIAFKSVGRLAAGVLLASTLAAAAGIAHPQRAAADEDLGAPTLLSVNVDGDTAYVSFRDNSSQESGYLIYGYVGKTFAAFASRPGVPGEGRAPTVAVEHVNPSLSYCFTVYAAETSESSPVGLATDSPPSNQICTTPQSPSPQQPAPPVLNPPFDPHTTAGVCLACRVDAPSSGPTNVPVLPDFTVSRISGDQSPAQGFTETYEVVVANLGAKPQNQVQVSIQVTGSLGYQQMVQTPAGFTCTGNGPVTCVGALGGYGDAPITTSADFQVQVYAAGPGLGSISAAADPNSLITESNKANNAQTLAVTVK